MAQLLDSSTFSVLTSAGALAAGWKLNFYTTGTSSRKNTYPTEADATAGTNARTNPVVLPADGRLPPIWLTSGAYKCVITDENDVVIETLDPVAQDLTAFITALFNDLFSPPDILVSDYGAVGDNVTDDYTAISNAATAAAAAGVTLVFDGSKTYRINQDTLTLPAGLSVNFNGATLNFTKTQGTSTNPAISATGPLKADWVRVNIPTGIRRNYGLTFSGDNVSVGAITLASVDQQAQLSASTDYGVQFADGANFQIGRVTITNFDRAAIIDTTTTSRFAGFDITSYVRGVWEVDNTNLYIGKSLVKTRSANGSQTAGHNSLLMTTSALTQYNITIEDFVSENAGEHGIRIGGGPQKNISLIRPRVFGAQACGIKSLGTDNSSPVAGEYHENLFIDQPIVEDCGSGTGAGSNLCGILIERANKTLIREPIIRKRDATYSAYYGIRCFGVTDLRITAPTILDTENEGFRLDTESSGAASADSARINVIGGTIKDCADDGMSFSATDSKTISQVRVEGVTLTTNNRGFVAAAGTGGSFTNCFVRAHLYLNTVDPVVCAASGWVVDLYGDDTYGSGSAAMSSVTATNGSRWSNETNLYVMKAGTWTAAA